MSKPSFGRAGHRCGQLVLHQLAQDEFQSRAADLQILRQPRREFHDAVIQKRRTHFERMRHAHAVALVEDVVGQIVELIQPQEAVQIADVIAGQRQSRLARPSRSSQARASRPCRNVPFQNKCASTGSSSEPSSIRVIL